MSQSQTSSRVVLTMWGLSLLGVAGACSSSATSAVDGGVGIVTGAVDDHCVGVTPIMVSQASCTLPPDASVPSGDDGGAPDDAGPEPPAPILYNAEADDDDCKYHVKFSSTPVLKDQNVTFNITVTKLAENNAPATNANPDIESYFASNDLHPIPNTDRHSTESPANSGKYTLGPVKFDLSGRWVVRFHLYEECEDILEDSPHGHVAFYFDVP
jgi:hypothetical protein